MEKLKLSEIRKILEDLRAQAPAPEESVGEFSQRTWEQLPRIPYKDLPASLQKQVRERLTPDTMRRFLRECYDLWPHVAQRMAPPNAAETGMNQIENYISFDGMTSDIPADDVNKLLIRARNMATYTIEIEEYSEVEDEDGTKRTIMNIVPMLYGNYAIEAFEALLQQYRHPVTVDNSKPKEGDDAPPVSILQEIQLPNEITFPKDLVTHKIFNNNFTPGKPGRVSFGVEITITDETGKKVKAPIASIVTVSLLDLPPNIQITREMTHEDDAVFRAVCSLWAAGNSRVTGNAIYATMIGNPDAKATPEWLAKIDECWTRQTSTQIKLDTGTVGDAYKFKRWERNRRVIEGGKDTLTIGNQFGQTTTTVYTILEEPLLQTYANALNQTARFPRAVLNTPVNKTPDVIALQNFLLDHICAIPRISNHILYDSIWKAMHLQDNTPGVEKRKEKMRNHIRKMLAYWKEIKFITRWMEVKQGNVLHHIEVVKPTQKELSAAAAAE